MLGKLRAEGGGVVVEEKNVFGRGLECVEIVVWLVDCVRRKRLKNCEIQGRDAKVGVIVDRVQWSWFIKEMSIFKLKFLRVFVKMV